MRQRKYALIVGTDAEDSETRALLDAGYDVEVVDSAAEAADRLAIGVYDRIVVGSGPDAPEKHVLVELCGMCSQARDSGALDAKLRESERRYRGIVESLPQLVWTARADGHADYLSRQWVEYTGIPEEEQLGWKWLDVLHPEDRENASQAWRAAVENEVPYDVEYRVRRHDGVYRWFKTRGVPYRDNTGRIVKWLSSSTDIDDQMRAEQALAQARAEAEHKSAQLESVMAGMADGLLLTDRDGRVNWINDAGRQVLGIPDGEQAGRWIGDYERFTPEGQPLPVEQTAWYQAMQGQAVKDARYVVVTPWGKRPVLSISAAPIYDAVHGPVGAAVAFRDVGERAELEAQKENLLERERKIADMLQQALIPSRVSYDIPGCRVAVEYRPGLDEATVGGDFYDIFELGIGKYGVLIGDIAGKGLMAAMSVAAARHTIRSYAYLDPIPAKVITYANEALCRDLDNPGMLTAFFAIIDVLGGVISYTNAGHEPPLVRDAHGNTKSLETSGRALGVFPDFIYSQGRHQLQPGDTIVMVTDGITESRSESGLFGVQGIIDYLASHVGESASEIASGLLERAVEHAGGHPQDDAAIVVIQPQSE